MTKVAPEVFSGAFCAIWGLLFAGVRGMMGAAGQSPAGKERVGMADLLSMGELLIDFTPGGTGENGRMLFARNPGGAPANVAVAAHRAGLSAGFLGCVGQDMFGVFLKDTLDACGVDTAGLRLVPQPTTLAFVSLDENGDRDFSFYRENGADLQLKCDEEALAMVQDCKVFCFGSLLLCASPCREEVKALVKAAKEAGKITAYDPNWRAPLWKDEDEGIEQMKSLAPFADVMKVSIEELAMLAPGDSMGEQARALMAQGPSLVAVTLGPAGCALFGKDFALRLPTYNTRVRDTTGSGDSFFGALLSKIVRSGKHPSQLSAQEAEDFGDYANAAGAICATKPGAIPAIATDEEIEACRKSTPKLIVK